MFVSTSPSYVPKLISSTFILQDDAFFEVMYSGDRHDMNIEGSL